MYSCWLCMFSITRQPSSTYTSVHRITIVLRRLSSATMPPKRKAPPQTSLPAPKKVQTADEDQDYDKGVVNAKYYPKKVVSNTRCREYIEGTRTRPIDELNRALATTTPIAAGRAVVHWFRTDLRTVDNTALHLASEAAQAAATDDCGLIGLFVFAPEDLEAFALSPARVDFMLRSLRIVKNDLAERGIPLWIETVQRRQDVPRRVLELCEEWGARRLFANMEYEVDELRRDAKTVRLGAERGVRVQVCHDTCVVPPGALLTKSTAKPFCVYTPWFRVWIAHLGQNPGLLTLHPAPAPNPPSAASTLAALFDSTIPVPPASHTLPPTELKTVHSLFPAGEHESQLRLTHFLSTRGQSYAADRNIPAKPGTSVLSPHFASGTLSARSAVVAAKKQNNNKLAGGDLGLNTWISEVAWRDFYRHVLAAFPHVCMNKPFKPEYHSIVWAAPTLSATRLEAWKKGETGYPIVDAAMRHLATQKWMPNRLRMVVASFLAKDLHVDWRHGERWFHETLVDGDFASNSGGWGWSSSAGVDPQPYFRVFNPERQSVTFDKDGEYIRTWVAELKGVKGAEIHNPSEKTRKKTGYVQRVVEHDVQRKEALEMYKAGIEKGKTMP